MRTRRAAALAMIAVLCAACGARLDAEQVAALGSGDARDASAQSAGPAAGPGATSTSTTLAAAAAPAGGPVDPGAAATPAPGSDPAAAPAAAGQAGAPCTPQHSDEVGVTDTDVTLGEVATISGPVPGLAQTTVDGVRAYLAYRNSIGGVCGRQLKVEVGDDRLDSGQNRAETQRLMGSVLGFVGGWGVTDDGGAGVLSGTNVPDVGIAISEARAALPNNFSTNPIPAGESGAEVSIDYILRTYNPASAAVVWPAQAVARGRAQGFVRALQARGVPIVVQREVSITETNWVPVAQEIEDAHAEFLITALEITQIARLAQAFQQVGYLPKVPFYGAQGYGPQFLQLAGPAADGAIMTIGHPIVEEAATATGLQTMVDWAHRVNPGRPIDFFTFQGWVAGAMFADAIEAAGPAPTRDSVLAVLRTFTSYDAGGLVAPFDPADKIGSRCFMVVTVQNQQWTRVFPDSGFHCE